MHDRGTTGTQGVNVDAPAAYFLLLYLPPSDGCIRRHYIAAYSAVTLLRERKHVNYSVLHPPAVLPTRLTASPFARFSSINLEISNPITNWTAALVSRDSHLLHAVFSPISYYVKRRYVQHLSPASPLRCLVVENDCI